MKNRLLLFTIIIISFIACHRGVKISEEIDKSFVGYYESAANASSGTALQLKKDGTYLLAQRVYWSCDAFLNYTGKWTSSGNQIILHESLPVSKYLSVINYSKNGDIDTIKLWEHATGFGEELPDDVSGNKDDELEVMELFVDTFEQEIFRATDIVKDFADTLIISLSADLLKALPELKFWIDYDTSILKIEKNQILIDKVKYIHQNNILEYSLNEKIESYDNHYYDLHFQSGNYYASIDHVFPYDSIQISLKKTLPKRSKLGRKIFYYLKDSLLVSEENVLLQPNSLVRVK